MEILIATPTTVIVFALGASVGSLLMWWFTGCWIIDSVSFSLSALLTPLGKRENVPVLGWLWLRGQCHHRKSKISVRYPW